MMDMSEFRDETDLDYCPRCGVALEGTRPIKCPEHGPVSLTYQEVPSADETIDELFGDGDDGLDDLENAIEEFREEMSDLDDHDRLADLDGRDENPRENMRDRLGRLFGRDR